MELVITTEFIARGTVKIWAYNYDEDGDLAVPGATIRVFVYDKDGVQKVGYLNVLATASFTAGETVVGADSGATGYIVHKVNAAQLELARVTGVWEDGEAVTSAGGTSTTTSVLLGGTMAEYLIGPDVQVGIYYYYFRTTMSDRGSRFQVEVESIDGSSTREISSIGTTGFKVK